MGVELSPVDVRDAGEIERIIAAFARESNAGLIVTASPSANTHRLRPGTNCQLSTPPASASQSGPHCLRGRLGQPVPPHGRLCGSHSHGREAGRSAGAGADEIRAGDQPQDRQDTGPYGAAFSARPRRRGDRIVSWFAAIAHSGFWHEPADPECPLSRRLGG